jgi:surfactin synthase thioesterase subunit
VTPKLRLFCLPYAGAGAAVYRGWRQRMPPCIDLIAFDLPGRGLRHGEPPLSDWRRLTDVVVAQARPYLAEPFAIFGHSMGALIALELAHAIRAGHGRTAVWLGVSGCQAPVRRKLDLKWLACDDEAVCEELRCLGGTPRELMENRDLLDLLLPALRADFHLCGSYRAPRREPLDCPMLVLGGTQDRISDPVDNLAAWSVETRGPSDLVMIDGDHFFIHGQMDAVLGHIVTSLSRLAGAVQSQPAWPSRGPSRLAPDLPADPRCSSVFPDTARAAVR